jgi:hypothetical protein
MRRRTIQPRFSRVGQSDGMLKTLLRCVRTIAAWIAISTEELNETLHSHARTRACTRTHSVHTYTRAGARAQT